MASDEIATGLSITEVYRQAQETRRKWEGYIWQWSIVLTILAAVFVQFSPQLLEPYVGSEPISETTTADESQQDYTEKLDDNDDLTSEYRISFSFPQKVILTLISLFVISIFLNVYRARVLMKELENSLSAFHKTINLEIPVVPLELDKKMSFIKRISSTRLSMYCHLTAVIVFLSLAIYAWCL